MNNLNIFLLEVIPKDYCFDDSEVFVNKIGDFVILIPKESKWNSLEKS